MEDSVDSVECPYKKAHIRIFLLDQGPILHWKKIHQIRQVGHYAPIFLKSRIGPSRVHKVSGDMKIFLYVSSAQASA